MKTMTSSNSIKLEVDPSLLKNRLQLSELQEDDEFDALVKNLERARGDQDADNIPWKNVKPKSGLCLKTRTTSGEKVFINICHTEDIPAPKDISDSELADILSSDEASSYRLPMSIGDLHKELDKSGFQCSVYDVAINSTFFKKLETNKLFHAFFVTVMLEGIQDKYKLEIDFKDYLILKNRKVMGSLQYHRIQQRAVGEGPKKQRCLIQEINNPVITKSKPTPPKFRIIRDPAQGEPELLTAQVYVKEAISSKNLTLDIGEDRLLLHFEKKQGSLLDIFLPYSIDQNSVCAEFNTDTKILTIKMPVLNSG